MSKLINKLRVWCNTDNGERPHSNKTYNKNKNYIIGRIVILCVVMLGILAITGCGCGGCGGCFDCFGCFSCFDCFGCSGCFSCSKKNNSDDSKKSDSCVSGCRHEYSQSRNTDYYIFDNGCMISCGGKDNCTVNCEDSDNYYREYIYVDEYGY